MRIGTLDVEYEGRNAEGLHEFRSPGLLVRMNDENIEALRAHPELYVIASLVDGTPHPEQMTGQG